MRTRRRMFDQQRTIGVERKLARSYSTIRECQTKAQVVFAGTRIVPSEQMPGTIAPGNLTAQHADGAVFMLGSGDSVIDGALATSEEEYPAELVPLLDDDADEEVQIDPEDQPQAPAPKPKTARKSTKNHASSQFLGRPTDLGTLE